MSRKYKIIAYRYADDATNRRMLIAGKIESLVVTDAITTEEANEELINVYRPPVAIFKINILNDIEFQQINAQKFCDYLNAIVDAKDQAVKDNALLQQLKL